MTGVPGRGEGRPLARTYEPCDADGRNVAVTRCTGQSAVRDTTENCISGRRDLTPAGHTTNRPAPSKEHP